jgi:hypothetical protein
MIDSDNDPYLDAIFDNWPKILGMYRLFEPKKPVMLYDLQEKKVYAYPYQEFKAEMNQRSQALLTEQYEQAIQNNQMVVFVRDNVKRKLGSYSLDLVERKTAHPGKAGNTKHRKKKNPRDIAL